MRWIVLASLATTLFPAAAGAQEAAAPPAGRPFGATCLWEIDAGNPQAVGTGLTLVLGQTRYTGPAGRANRIVRGAVVASSVGIGGLSARVGWARLYQYDVVAAADGWSVEAVYARPWLLQWGLRRD